MQALPAYVGRYQLREEIGRGSFATVALAWDEELQSSVALKILNVTDTDTERRFLNEARLLRRVKAPNVVTVHDIGRLNDARPYFVLDYADRGSLAERLPHPIPLATLTAENPSRPNGAAVDGAYAELQALLLLVDALAEGLSAIHAVGLVHRDIKPGNVFFESVRRSTQEGVGQPLPRGGPIVRADERPLVGDLGIAKDVNAGNEQPTLLGGTPLYLAPEQLDPTAVISPAADIYAASAVVWNVATGSPPPLPDRLDEALATLPAPWRTILSVGLAREPAHRFDSMDTWRWAIHDVVGNAGRTVVIAPGGDATATEVCPYKGLAAYQAEDAERFCGREALVDELLGRLQLHAVLVVGGASGSGKSSLVRAGLLPALASGSLPGSEAWRVRLLTPGAEPLARLQSALTASEAGGPARLVVIDQFEELFTLAEPAARTAFLDALATYANRLDSEDKLVIVVRADFYAECAREPWLAHRISNNQVLVSPMRESELRQAISEPARRSGYFLENGLIDAILEQAGDEAGALPLVAHALVETWVRREGNTLTLAGFQAAGGVVGAISQTADASYEHQLDDTGREQTRRLMLRLVAAGTSASPDTRRVVSRAELRSADVAESIDASVIRVLTDARLLSIDDDTVQIAHEALLHSWPRLHRWIEESRDDLRVRHKISRAAQDWEGERRDADLLYRGTPLQAAIEWQTQNPGLLNPLEQDFLDTSQAESEARATAEAAQVARGRRVRRLAVAALTVLALGASVSTLIAYTAFRNSQRQAQRADAATLAAETRFASALGAAAYGHVEEDPRLSLVLAAESTARAHAGATPYDTRAAMVSARHALAQGGPFLFGGPLVASDALSVALNPQGSMLALGLVDGSVDLINTANRKPIQARQRDHSGGVRDIAFSPDGRALVSVSTDGGVRLWRANSAGVWRSVLVARSRDVIVDVDFMPDGHSVITANDDGTVQRFFLDGRTEHPPPIVRSDYGFNAVGISSDGRYVVTGNADKRITAYAIESGERVLGPIDASDANHLVDISFNVDGTAFAVVDTDGFAHVHAFPGGELDDARFDFSGRLGVLFFHPDGERLIGGDGAGRLNQWSIGTGELQRQSPPGHSQTMVASSLSADGGLLVTLGRDQLVRFWTLDERFPLSRSWAVATSAARGVSVSPSGRFLAAADKSGLVQLRRTEAADRPLQLRGHMAGVWALAFDPGEAVLASGDRHGRIRLWDAITGQLLDETTVEGESIWSLAFDAAGTSLLIGSDSGVHEYAVSERQWRTPVFRTAAQLTRLAISHDRRRLAVSDAVGNLTLIDLGTRETLLALSGGRDTVWSVALSADNAVLAAASGDEIVSLYATETGERIARLTGHAGGATNVGFLADGVTLVATDRKGHLHWWDLETARRLASPIKAHRRAIWRLQVHADGTRVATAGDDGTVQLWDVMDPHRACVIGLPGFDATRRLQYLGDARELSVCGR
ncbi:MAG: protein kinase [Pseudomonadota bacterium]